MRTEAGARNGAYADANTVHLCGDTLGVRLSPCRGECGSALRDRPVEHGILGADFACY